MAKLRKFVLEGEAMLVDGELNVDQEPEYTVSLNEKYAYKRLTGEELLEFAKALSHDAEAWEGILHRFPEEQFTYSVLAKFEEAWGGKADGIRMQATPEE